MKALSIVSPNGTRIARGFKTIEVRSWTPTIDLESDFLIVENDHFLKDGDVDNNGRVVAIAQIQSVGEFTKDDIGPACANYWAADYYSWELKNIRPVSYQKNVDARLGLYDLEIVQSELKILETKIMAVVIEDYEVAYPNPIQLSVDDQIVIEKYETNPDWKGWVFCVDKQGIKGWVSESNLLISGNIGKVLKAYDATEIAVKKNEVVRCHHSEFGWTWIESRDGKEGWVPSKILEGKK